MTSSPVLPVLLTALLLPLVPANARRLAKQDSPR